MEKDFWDHRYFSQTTGWDIGKISTPIKTYIDQLTDVSLKILIPGCGFGHEANYLFEKGFTHTYVLDFSPLAINGMLDRYPNFPKENCMEADFFEFEGKFDLIIEQTLFCAINPERRDEYVNQIKNLLNPKGKLVGLLFNCEFESGPPFGGSKDEYINRFKPHFDAVKMEVCYNSIEARKNRELFIQISNTAD